MTGTSYRADGYGSGNSASSSAGDSLRIRPVAAPVREQVLANLRQAIVELRFQPSERLLERDLIELTGASRTSVREAMRQLATEGLITTIPHKGTFVRTPSREEAEELYEVRQHLEGLAAATFTRRASAEDVERLRATCERIAACPPGSTTPGELRRLKDDFYEILGSHNSTVFGILSQLHARIALLRSLTLAQPDRLASTVQELRVIVDAVAAGNAEAAAEASRQHVAKAADVALAILDKQRELRDSAPNV